MQRPLDEVQLMVSQMNLDHVPPEDAQVIRVAIAYEATNPHRQMLWFQEASQNQGLYFNPDFSQTSKKSSKLPLKADLLMRSKLLLNLIKEGVSELLKQH